MEERKVLTTVGFQGYKYADAKHLITPVMPEGKPTQILAGKNMYADEFMLRTFPGIEKLMSGQMGEASYRRILGIHPYITTGGIIYYVICTARHIYSYTPGASSATEITGTLTLTGTNNQAFDATYWADTTTGYEPWVIITNGVDQPFYWNGSGNCAELANAPKGKHVDAFNNHVFFSNISGAGDYLQRDQWSNVDDATNWSTGNAGSNDLRDDAGGVQGSLTFGDLRFILKENSIATCRSTGYDPPFRYDEGHSPVGCVAPNTIVRCWLYNRGFFMGNDLNLYLIAKDGFHIPIGDDITHRIRDWTNDETVKYSFAFYYPALDSIILAVPMGNSDWCEAMFAFNMGHYVRTGQAVWSPPIITGKNFSCGIQGKLKEFWTIGQLGGVYDTIGDVPNNFGDYYTDASFARTLLGDDQGYIYRLNENLSTFDGTDISWEIETPDYKLAGEFARNFRLTEYNLQWRKKGNVTATVQISTDGGATYDTGTSVPMWDNTGADDEEMDADVWVDSFGKKHRMKISGTGMATLSGQRFIGTDEER